jgi:hypothetical protein
VFLLPVSVAVDTQGGVRALLVVVHELGRVVDPVVEGDLYIRVEGHAPASRFARAELGRNRVDLEGVVCVPVVGVFGCLLGARWLGDATIIVSSAAIIAWMLT